MNTHNFTYIYIKIRLHCSAQLTKLGDTSSNTQFWALFVSRELEVFAFCVG